MKYVIDAGRAGAVLDEYFMRWRPELTTAVRGVVLDFKLNKLVDDLCLRIAADTDSNLKAEPRELRALLAARLNVCQAAMLNDPDAEVLSTATRLEGAKILSGLLTKVVSKAKLPKAWDGQPFEGSR